MNKRAEAFAHYNEAAVLQMLIEVLPQIAKEVAAPISAIDNLTIISSDGAGALPAPGDRQRGPDAADAQDRDRPRPAGPGRAVGVRR